MKPANRTSRKIVLRRQTLRVLSPRQLTDAVGGELGTIKVPEDSIDGHCTLSNAVNCAELVGQR